MFYKTLTLILILTTLLSALGVISPNGKENWLYGNTETIEWSGDYFDRCMISYTTGDKVWHIIHTYTKEDSAKRTHEWEIPNLYSAKCAVRVQYVGKNQGTDESNAAFTIWNEPLIWVYRPNQASGWTGGTSEYIKWVASPHVKRVRIYYSLDAGNTYTHITTKDQESTYDEYLWDIPDVTETCYHCYIKIEDQNTFDISAKFQIHKGTGFNTSYTYKRIKPLIYPNPFNNFLYLKGKVYDLAGKLIYSTDTYKKVNTTAWKPGVYLTKDKRLVKVR